MSLQWEEGSFMRNLLDGGEVFVPCDVCTPDVVCYVHSLEFNPENGSSILIHHTTPTYLYREFTEETYGKEVAP